jgi:hypothetical protein
MNNANNMQGAADDHARFFALKKRLRAVAPRRTRIIPVREPVEIQPGQVWETRAEPVLPTGIANQCRTEKPFQVLVVSVIPEQIGGRQLIDVAPLSFESEMAGPDDCVLPREILGYDAVALFSATVTMLGDNLLECRGQLPGDIAAPLLDFDDWLRNPDSDTAPPGNIRRGKPYFYEGDLRWNWHRDLAAKLDYLQTPCLAWLVECGELEWEAPAETGLSDKIVPFPVKIETDRPTAMAAAAGAAERPLEFHVLCVENSDIRLHLAELENQPGAFAVVVENDTRGLLEEAKILDASGNQVGVIRKGRAGSSEEPLRLERKGSIEFSLFLADDSPVKLVSCSDVTK